VDNPASEQCIPELTMFPQQIKEYILQKAHDEIDCGYEIPLKHQNTIHRFDIHSATDKAVTYSLDYTLRVWDLTTASVLFTLARDIAIDLVRFNYDGSLVATASRYITSTNDEISHVNIYNIISRKLLHSIQHDARIYHIQFVQQSPSILIMFSKKKCDDQNLKMVTALRLNTKKPVAHRLQVRPWQKENFIKSLSDKYAGYIEDEDNTVRVIKKKCVPLYICTQAIYNSERLDKLDNILKSQQYQQLTKYEKQLIIKKIEQEKSWSRNSPMLLALQRK
jgi:WD40 repeat protein